MLGTFNKEEHEKELMETFRKMEMNIPILDAIKQVPQYNFLQGVYTTKRELEGNKVVSVGESCLAKPQREIPPKLKNPKSFTIICTFEAKRYHNNFNYYLSIDTSNSLIQPIVKLKDKNEWEESIKMLHKEEQVSDKFVKTLTDQEKWVVPIGIHDIDMLSLISA